MIINWHDLRKVIQSLAKAGYKNLKYKIVFSNDTTVESISPVQEILTSIWLSEEQNFKKVRKITLLGAKDKILYTQEVADMPQPIVKPNDLFNDYASADDDQKKIMMKIFLSSLSFHLYASKQNT